jgi:aminomethyltransferase
LENNLKFTPLHSLHLELGAKMVPFAGYEMPVQFPAGIMSEHLHTRQCASLFDVSHMGQVELGGQGAAVALEKLVPADIVSLSLNRQRYALLTNAAGGIIDDLMVSNLGDRFVLVVNAACKDTDLEYLEAELGEDCDVTAQFNRALLALQGPASAQALQKLIPGVESMRFMDAREFSWGDDGLIVSRSGYTGEDGFEVSLAAELAEPFARKLLEDELVAPAGLGARDSLRLEAGLCLYGQDIDAETSPVEAQLQWSIGKARRPGGEREGGYPGSGVIGQQLQSGAARKRVGIRPNGRAPVREGTVLHNDGDEVVGIVTSGGFGPSVKGPVAMALVESEQATLGVRLDAIVRGKSHPVTVCELPFLPHNYHRG